MRKQIAIKGDSDAHIAAYRYFGDTEIVSCSTWRQLFRVTENDRKIYAGVLPIDDFNYRLLQATNLWVTGEIYLPDHRHSRFIVVQMHEAVDRDQVNKASIFFETDDERGGLATILYQIAESDINLSRLNSVPTPRFGGINGYHADLEFDQLSDFNTAIDRMKLTTEKIIIYGVYKKCAYAN